MAGKVMGKPGYYSSSWQGTDSVDENEKYVSDALIELSIAPRCFSTSPPRFWRGTGRRSAIHEDPPPPPPSPSSPPPPRRRLRRRSSSSVAASPAFPFGVINDEEEMIDVQIENLEYYSDSLLNLDHHASTHYDDVSGPDGGSDGGLPPPPLPPPRSLLMRPRPPNPHGRCSNVVRSRLKIKGGRKIFKYAPRFFTSDRRKNEFNYYSKKKKKKQKQPHKSVEELTDEIRAKSQQKKDVEELVENTKTFYEKVEEFNLHLKEKKEEAEMRAVRVDIHGDQQQQ